MPNMSYCRFRNTLGDLRECYEHMAEDDDSMGDDEKNAKAKLIKLCKRIADEYTEDDED